MVRVNDDVIPLAEQRNPDLAVDVDGNVYVVWEDLRDDDDGEIYFSRWMSGTAWGAGTWSTPSRLCDPTMDWGADPVIISGPNAVLFAAWMERVPTGPATYDFQIVVARSQDNGDTWIRSVVRRLYSASASNASYANPAIGVDFLERVYVAWLYSPDQQAATASVLFSLSPDRGEHWTEPRTLNQPSNEVAGSAVPALITDFAGHTAVAWQDFREGSSTQIYATGYPSDDYLTSGEYRSRVFDAGGLAAWDTITWTAALTPNTGLILATCAMTTVTADCADWVTHTASGDALSHPAHQFIQYRAVFTSTGTDTSVLDEVVIFYEQYRILLPIVLRGN